MQKKQNLIKNLIKGILSTDNVINRYLIEKKIINGKYSLLKNIQVLKNLVK